MNDTELLIILIVAILVILLIIYFICNRENSNREQNGKKKKWRTIDDIYGRSDGDFDYAAQFALNLTENMPEPTPHDHLRAANIYERNILAHTNIFNDPFPAEQRGDFRRRAAGHIANALFDIGTADTIVHIVNGEWETPRVIHRYNGNNTVAVEEDDLDDIVNQFTLMMEAEGQNGVLGDMMPLLYGMNTNIQREKATTRKEEARRESGGVKGAVSKKYFEKSKKNRSDPENVHDSSVSAERKKIMNKLREAQGNKTLPTLEDISREIEAKGNIYSATPTNGKLGAPRKHMVDKAIDVIKRAERGDYSKSTESTDEEVLRRVWERANEPDNEPNREKLRQSYFDSLVDCWEGGVIKCVDGRIGRLISSLELLDYDCDNWGVTKTETYKNEMFDIASKTIEQNAKDAAEQNEDIELKKVGLAYIATSVTEMPDTDAKKEREWIIKTRRQIEEKLDSYISAVNEKTPGAISEQNAKNIKEEACAAL